MKISVVIPLYNKKETILRALNSVLIQTVLPEEIIVVNDGSTDGSEINVAELNHPLIKIISQTNAGVSAARNKGIAEAKGDWIAFLDADDEWLPQFLETIYDLKRKFSNGKVIATAYYLKYQSNYSRPVILKHLHFTGTGLIDNYFEVAATGEPPLNSSSVVVHKQTLLDIGGFPEGIKSGEDLLTWAKICVREKIAYSTTPFSIFMIDEYSKTRFPGVPDFVGSELYNLAKKHIFPFLKQYISVWHKMRANSYLMLGHRNLALKEIGKSIKYNFFTRAWWFLPFVLLNRCAFRYAVKEFRRLLR